MFVLSRQGIRRDLPAQIITLAIFPARFSGPLAKSLFNKPLS